MKRPLPRKLKRILGEPTRPPKSKRWCLYCDKLRTFVYDRFVGHSACKSCGCRFTKKPEDKENQVKE